MIKTNLKISFIVPVYNVEKYLEKCIESIVNQTIDSKEIILIDDGSTDKSLDICYKYRKIYNNIKVISKENGGQSSARNMGIGIAVGKYIQFVDADDWIDDRCGEVFYKLCEENNLDMIRGKYHILFEEKNEILEPLDISNFKYLNKSIESREYFSQCIKEGCYEVTPILGLIKREFIIMNKLYFSEGLKMEDHEFTMKLLTKNEKSKVMQVDYDFYTYRRRQNSTTTTACVESIKDIIKNYDNIIYYIEEMNFKGELKINCNKATSALLYQATSIYGRLKKCDKKEASVTIPRKYVDFSIVNAINNHQRFKFILFNYCKFIVDIVYSIKFYNNKKIRK